jgi:YD repeat-containing protein
MNVNKTPAISDREKAGLRGPVRECTEERTTPAFAGHPETKYSSTSEYDTEGRVIKTIVSGQDGSKWISSHIYDVHGQLVKTTSGNADATMVETTYRYDEKGRLSGYASPGAMGSETTRFEYDERGRKTRVVISDEPASARGPYGATSFAYSAEGADLYYPAPKGGSVRTLYDENDRPIETQVYVAEGQMLQRLVQSYDAGGRPSETKILLGDPLAMLPAEFKTQVLNEPGGAEEMQRHIAELFGVQGQMFKTSYVYDPEGRLTEKRIHIGYNEETVTSFAYDGNGNKIREISKTSGDANPPRNDGGVQSATAAPDGWAQGSEVTYSYKYDGYGNWTEQAAYSKSRPDGASENAAICRRTITYY